MGNMIPFLNFPGDLRKRYAYSWTIANWDETAHPV